MLGKPALAFFRAALDELGTPAASSWMIGDDVRGDIGGAQTAGLRGMLVLQPDTFDGFSKARNGQMLGARAPA